jgi:hypothetical protein
VPMHAIGREPPRQRRACRVSHPFARSSDQAGHLSGHAFDFCSLILAYLLAAGSDWILSRVRKPDKFELAQVCPPVYAGADLSEPS